MRSLGGAWRHPSLKFACRVALQTALQRTSVAEVEKGGRVGDEVPGGRCDVVVRPAVAAAAAAAAAAAPISA